VRILYHHRTLGDGAEGVHIAAMVQAFRSLGHDVRVCGVQGDGGHRKSHLVQLVRGAMPRPVFELSAAAYNTLEYRAVRSEIESFRPDLLYKRHAKYDLAALAAARSCAVPRVLEVNCVFSAPDYERFEPLMFRRLARSMERRAVRLADLVVAVSSPLEREIRRLAPEANAVTIPNGTDPALFDPARHDGAPVRARIPGSVRFVVGWVGILREWHGLELLIEAMRQLPNASLLIVGDGPERDRIGRHLHDCGLGGRTLITGRIPHAQMPTYISAMDVAVVPDERTRIASPMKLTEYMSMGRSVVAPRLDNIADIVSETADGLLFEPGNAQDLATQLRRLESDTDLRGRLGAQARLTVVSRRNWVSIANAVLSGAQAATKEAP
jgi:glycosyltransferase involved in cell wall biosynthesis